MSDSNENRTPPMTSKRGKKLILDPSAPKRGTLVKLTGDETDEELKEIAQQMYRALLPEMSDEGPP